MDTQVGPFVWSKHKEKINNIYSGVVRTRQSAFEIVLENTERIAEC